MNVKLMLTVLALFALASPMMAQEAGGGTNWVAITSGFSMAIASAGCAIAQAKAVAASVEGMGRNPSAAGAIRFALLLGLVLIESLALYTLAIIFLKVA